MRSRPESLHAAHRRARHEGRRRALREGRPGRASRTAGRAAPVAGARPTEDGGSAPAPLAIAGTEGLLVSYARCCFPIPYDPIFAFLSAGRGIVIHRENCVNVEDYRKHPEKWLPVTWQTSPDRLFSSEIRVDVANRTGVLAAVAAAIASTETNIDHVSVEERDSDTSMLVFELKVHDRKHLARIVRMIRRMPDVLRVTPYHSPRMRATSEKMIQPKGAFDDDPPDHSYRPRAARRSAPIRRPCARATPCTCPARFRSTRRRWSWSRGDIEAEIRRVFENLQGRGRSRGRLARAGGEGQRVPHRPRELREGERGDGAVFLASPIRRAPRSASRSCPGRARRDRVRALPWLKRHSNAARARAEQRPITAMRGVGPTLAERLQRLGVAQVQDLLFVLPLRYEDRTQIVPIGALLPGMRVAVEGEVQLTEVTLSPAAAAAVAHLRRLGLSDAAFLLFLRRSAERPRARHAAALFRRSAPRAAGPRDRASGVSARAGRARRRSKRRSRRSIPAPKAWRRAACAR